MKKWQQRFKKAKNDLRHGVDNFACLLCGERFRIKRQLSRHKHWQISTVEFYEEQMVGKGRNKVLSSDSVYAHRTL